MPLFQCQECGAVDNTALGSYWWRTGREKLPAQCVECEMGKWHGLFPKEDAAAAGYLLGEDGFLYKAEPGHTRILGPVPPLKAP